MTAAKRIEGKKYNVSIRMQQDFARRAEALVPAIALHTGIETNASEVMRTAIRKGLAVLEQENGIGKVEPT